MSEKKKKLEDNLKGLFSLAKNKKPLPNLQVTPPADEQPAVVPQAMPVLITAEPKTVEPKTTKPKVAESKTTKPKAVPKPKETPIVVITAEPVKPVENVEPQPAAPLPPVETPVVIAEKIVAAVSTPSTLVQTQTAPAPLAIPEPVKDAPDRQLLLFQLAGESYGVDVKMVRTIIKPQPVYLLPGSVNYMKGLINLRGEVVPVFSLRTRFELDEIPQDSATRFIVVEVGDYLASMVVDSVIGVETIPGNLFGKPSNIVMSVDTHYLSQIAQYNDQLILVLNIFQTIDVDEKLHREQGNQPVTEFAA